ncbi:4-(cytidine 5'-diphospho)-2-C-methyl-D-erythritol kinase [Cypionkella sp.]|uniref:4-(cytidine 5'-diphospho)-2-C-methyl-D-erythritol kinase n=1 Tax=Cypionkella sp. TaxID=2811411 RepID=UPI00275E9A80|nr:4-(cytidine 5'-diphospho)-2-C-methyl-D-erythritol kinase [Cypionkella sp.]
MFRTVTEQAFAKINLTLHITGQREDGYHLLDSLTVFTSITDKLTATRSGVFSLTLEGPFGREIPADFDNLVLRAARMFTQSREVAFTLDKHLPPASGIGGGSADAAAAIRAMLRLLQIEDDPDHTEAVFASLDRAAVLALGADVPVCLFSQPARMRGIGNDLTMVDLPRAWITLVNPRVEVPTPQVFKALQSKTNAAMPDSLPTWPNAAALAEWLQGQRNDLEPPARAIAPVISDVIAVLARQSGALIARMSGSGATCFALFATQAEAEQAASQIRAAHPQWWTAAGEVFPGDAAAQSWIS